MQNLKDKCKGVAIDRIHRMGAINFIELTLKKWSHKLEPQAIRTSIVELTNTLRRSQNSSPWRGFPII